jgi:hypothetical protein
MSPLVPNGQFPGDFDAGHFDQLGVIEVIVLRCRAKPGEDNGSGSFTHDSILGEIATLGRTVDDLAAPDGGVGNRQPSVVDAPEAAEELAGLAGIHFDGAADQPRRFGGDNVDQLHQFGLDGAAPPGYWTYHLQPPPRNNYRTENRPARRVHFDYGSPHYSTRPPHHPQSGQPQGGYRDGPASDGLPQPTPACSEKTSRVYGMPNDAPQGYGEAAHNEYSYYDDYYIPPPVAPVPVPVPAPPLWTAHGYSGDGHFGLTPTAPPPYPVWTPQPHFGLESGYPATLAVYPPFHPAPCGFQGPGYTMNYPIPAGGWLGNHSRQPMNLNPVKEESNQTNDSGNQANNDGGGNTHGNDSTARNNGQGAETTTGSGWDQGGNVGDTNNTNDANNNAWPDNGDPNKSGDQQPANNDNNNTAWDNPAPDNSHKTQSGWDGNNTQNTETQGNWDSNDAQNNQIQGSWDNNANDTVQPLQAQNDWNAAGSQLAPQLSPRLNRPLYGPYGAYCNSRPRSTLSPPAEAEEEPPFDVPETIAADKGTTRQVQPGKGYLYTHKRASPEYIDSIEEPYARFVFKYRTKGKSPHRPRLEGHDGQCEACRWW